MFLTLISSETKISLLFDGFFFRYFSLQKSLYSLAMRGFCKKNYRKNNHVKIVSLFLSHYLLWCFRMSIKKNLHIISPIPHLKFTFTDILSIKVHFTHNRLNHELTRRKKGHHFRCIGRQIYRLESGGKLRSTRCKNHPYECARRTAFWYNQ